VSSSSGVAAVEATGLAKRYGRTWALRGIDFRVASGEAVALLGPNGSGKSTLLRILCTGAQPTAGDARVSGFSCRTDGEAIRRRVGFLPDRPYLYAELTAFEHLKFAAAMYGLNVSEAVLRDGLRRVGLAHVADARVRTFSQGMAQRLSLARVILHDPALVLLDEPYNALDAEGLHLVDRFLADLRAAGKTAILVTHQIAKGLTQCERVIALRTGRVVYDGPSATFAGSQALEVGAWE